MDGSLFDEFTRSMTRITPRRALARTMLAGLGAVGLTRLGVAPAEAACRAPGKPCRRSKQCCSGTCRRKRGEREGRCRGRCPANACRPGLTCCGGKCTRLATDPRNCGECGIVCPSGICRNGVCGCEGITPCPEGCLSCFVRNEDRDTAACIGITPICTEPETLDPCETDKDCGLGRNCISPCPNNPELGSFCSNPCGVGFE